MPKNIHIRIAEPCHQNWNEMTPTQQGAFCHSCKKNVIDFTRKTENEIYDLVTQPTAQLCGRFTQFQLQQPVRKTEVKNGLLNWRAIAASLAGLLALGKQATASDLETKPKADTTFAAKTDTAFVAKNDLQVNIEAPKTKLRCVESVGMFTTTVITDTTQHRLKGQVLDAEFKEPLAVARLMLKEAGTGTTADFDGYFDFGVDMERYKNDTLVINYVGYEQKEIPLAEFKTDEPILLNPRETFIQGDIVVITMGKISRDVSVTDEQGSYNDLTPWFERHKTRRINKGK